MSATENAATSVIPADTVRWIKTAACALSFIAAAAYFSYVSRDLLDDYFILLAPSKELTLPWLIHIGVASFFLLLTFGVTAVLVRPPLVAAAAFVAGMAVYALVLGGDQAVWLAALALSVMLVVFLFSVVQQLENQVDFSAKPLGDKELLLCSLLAILLAVPAGLGYVRDSTRKNYVIPPQITAKVRAQADGYVTTMVDSQHLPAAERKLVLAASEEQMASWIGDAEKKAEPYRTYIPYLIGAAAYFTFQLALFVPGMLVAALLGPLFSLLTLTGFSRVSRFMRVVSRLTLRRRPAGAGQKEEASAD